MKNKNQQYSLLALAIATTLPMTAQAAGFKLYEQSTSAMGNAYAGRGAQITDASVGYTNPAAFILLDKAQLSVGLNVVNVTAKYSNAAGTSAQGAPVAGPNKGDVGGLSALPHFHYYQPINDKLGFGFSVAVPFGTSTDYDQDFVGRYFSQETDLKTIAFQPALSYKVNDQLALGVGVALNYASGTLSKYKDHGGLCETGSAINGLYAQATKGKFTNVEQTAYCDSVYEVSGDDFKLSYTLGVHYAVNDSLRLALSYHSKVNYTLKGDSTINNTPITGEFAQYTQNPDQYLILAAKLPVIDLTTNKLGLAAPKTEKSKLGLHTPRSVIISVDGDVNSKFSLQFSAIWTQWSKFTDITVLSDDTVPSISGSTQQSQNLNSDGYIGFIPEYWHDAWSFSAGANYKYSNDLTLKMGLARDNSPVDDKFRSARIPADDRTWVTFGVHYQPEKTWSIDAAMGMMFMDNSKVLDHEYNAQTSRIYKSSYQADYDINAYVMSFQFNYFL